MNLVVASAIAVMGGTALGWGRGSLSAALIFLTLCAIVARAALSPRRTAMVSAALIALASGAGASAALRSSSIDDALLPRLALRGSVVQACGSVRGSRPRSIEVDVRTVWREPDRWTVREPLRVAGRGIKQLRAGERFCATGALLPPREGRDETPLLFTHVLEKKGTGSQLRLAAHEIRERFSGSAQHALPRTQAGLLLGMTDGDTTLIDEATIEAFRKTGLAHLVAVSGQNVAILLVVVLLVSRALVRRGRWLRVLVALPPLVFFAFLTGLEPSVLRAVITAGIALAVTADGRTTDALRVALAALTVLVLASPDVLFDQGFQLSFAATFGLILWAAPLTERIAKHLPETRVAKGVAVAMATTLAAQAAVAPLLAWRFGRVPAVGGLANLLCVPLAPIITIAGLATLSVASLVPFLDWAPAVVRLPLDFILGCASWFSRLPLASVGASLVIGSAVATALAAFVSRSPKIRAGAVALTVVFCAVAVGQARAVLRCEGSSVVALDVGQGTAVLLRADGHDVLVDGGPLTGQVVADLARQGVSHLDAAFVSHPHADHTQGIADAIERIDVDHVLAPVTIPWGWGAEVVRNAMKHNVRLDHTASGDRYTFGDAIIIDVLWPDPGPAPTYSPDLIHPWGLVLRALVDGVTVILPGDLGAREEAKLVDSDVGAPVLIAPHHGSKDIDRAFIEAVSPKLTLVTVGEDNPYGHPTAEALREYARHGRVFRTDRHGAVSVCLANEGAEVTTQK